MHATPTRSGIATPVPIGQLSTYTARWTIKAKVVEKSFQSFKRSSSGAQGSLNSGGKILTTDLMDVEGDVIRAKYWGEAAEKWNQSIEKGKIYTFRGGRITVSNKRYNNTPHAYELTFFEPPGTEITLCEEDDTLGDGGIDQNPSKAKAFPAQPKPYNYKFKNLRDIRVLKRPLPFHIDVLGVVHSFQEVQTMQRNQPDTSGSTETVIRRRTISVVDSSEHEMEVTIWPPHDIPDTAELMRHPTVAFRSLQIREWRGRVASAVGMSTVTFNPDVDEARQLAKWYSENAKKIQFKPLRDQMADAGGFQGSQSENAYEPPIKASLSTIYRGVLGMNTSESKVYDTKAYVSRFFFTNRDQKFIGTYMACPKCRKKIMGGDQGNARCENCNMGVEPSHRFMMGVSLIDQSRGKFIVRGFHESCERILGKTAEECYELSLGADQSESSLKDSERLNQLFDFDALWLPYRIKLRCRREVFQGVARNNIVITHIESLKPLENTNELLKGIWSFAPHLRRKAASEGLGQNAKRRRRTQDTKSLCRVANRSLLKSLREKAKDESAQPESDNVCA